ncbi:YVTN family beta-propeller protein [Aeromicrobium panaciterrae]|uniref:YVTN family beta-propeller protein n=1 Tax=Aeromicrobium panaciterrae TaxID=363861 RepID=A0ABU1UJX3_9ACTN|nr:serine/threonine protein kinase [Aeromicrobium panaciterrae]MDR7085485.1 YVTN family beta-propeller protein [Aeromicrobium panaciterrae]
MRRTLKLSLVLALIAPMAVWTIARGGADAATTTPKTVMFVGNNWDGTTDVIDPVTFKRLKRIDVAPDRKERIAAIQKDPVALAFYLAIGQLVGEGHDQFNDDMFSTPDGKILAVSRPSLADVVGINIASGKIVWRFPMEGYRTDHMGVSPDGTKLLVSDSTANKVHELNIRTGAKLREFPSGDTPHESNYTKDGGKIFHASIGRVYVPADLSGNGSVNKIAKGKQVFQIVDNKSFKILKTWDMGAKLAEAGYPGMSSAVRPMAVAPDERYVYLQVSYFHGFVEFDTKGAGKVVRLANLPQSAAAQKIPKSKYVLNSAHHGIAMNAAGTSLCVAGTMSDYAAIVSRKTFSYKILDVGPKPYWATTGPGGKTCWMSTSGNDQVAVIDYATKKIIKRIAVGDHPQRVREGRVAAATINAWK